MRACTAVPHCLISHTNYIQRLGKSTDLVYHQNCLLKYEGNFPVGHKTFKEHGSRFCHNNYCAPFTESRSPVLKHCLPWMLLLAILGHPFECVSHFTRRHTGLESGLKVCHSSELSVIWPTQSLLILVP